MGIEQLEREAAWLVKQKEAGKLTAQMESRLLDIVHLLAAGAGQAVAEVGTHVTGATKVYAAAVATDVLRRYSTFRMRWGAVDVTKETINTVLHKEGGVFTMLFRAYTGDYWNGQIPIDHWRAFAEDMGDYLESTLLERIKHNIRRSFDVGGRLRGDIEGSGKWLPLSDKYVKYQKGGDRRFGIFSGGMFRNLYRGAIKIHFDPKHAGAREFSIDFGRGEVGRKLALFYHGRSRGRGVQPARPFTFLTKQDFNKITSLVKKHFKIAINDTRRFFVGLAFGPMPVPRKMKKHVFPAKVHARRISVSGGKK